MFHQPVRRKLIPALFALLFVFVPLLTACGSDSANSGPVTITMGWWANNPEKDARFKAWAESFTKKNPNIKVKIEILNWANYWTKIQTTTAGGNAYDVIGVASGQATQYYDKNVFLDLSQFSDYNDVASQLTSASVDVTNWGDKKYGIPLGVATFALGYNRDMLKAANLPEPPSDKSMEWSDFVKTYSVLSKPGTQYAVHPNYVLEYEAFINMAGGHVYDRQLNPTKVTTNTPEAIAGLKAYKQMFDSHLSPPFNELTGANWKDGDLDSILTNKVAFARIGAWSLGDIVSKKLNVGICPLPAINGKSAMVSGANSLSIFKGSKHQKEAWEFIKWAASADGDQGFSVVSDPPSNKSVLDQYEKVITDTVGEKDGKGYYQAFVVSLKSQVASPMSTKSTDLNTAFSNIMEDMIGSKITPEQAAAQMEKDGNDILKS
jgi:multiple sugar transport system substrate-binding protein